MSQDRRCGKGPRNSESWMEVSGFRRGWGLQDALLEPSHLASAWLNLGQHTHLEMHQGSTSRTKANTPRQRLQAGMCCSRSRMPRRLCYRTLSPNITKKHLAGSRAACRAGSGSYHIGGLTGFNCLSAPFTLSHVPLKPQWPEFMKI